MNIKINKPVASNLNESEQQADKVITQEFNNDLLEIVLKTKSKQFVFDCEIIMANINVPLNTRFGLKWHFDNSNSVEEFISSVEKFIAVSDNSLTETDRKNLAKQFELKSKKG